MAEDLIDSHVSLEQAQKAINALHKHAKKRQEEREETELLPGKEQNVWLVVGVKKIYPEGKLKPFKIPIKHVITDPRESNVCLITKDPQREYKDLLEQQNIKFISRVVGINKLKGKWKPFEARRMLLKENGLFLADDRVIPLLPKLLGKIFFEARKQPLPVNLTKKDLRTELENAINSTYMHQNQGTCTSVKIATINHSPTQVLENLQAALPAIISHIRDGWDNIQSLHIKTNSSTSLPIWTCELGSGPGGRWHGLTAAQAGEWGGVGGSDEEDTVSPIVEKAKAKSQKRKGSEDELSPPKKSKKARADDTESSPPRTSKNSKDLPQFLSTPISKQSRDSIPAPSTDPIKRKKKKKDEITAAEEPAAPPPTPATPAIKKKSIPGDATAPTSKTIGGPSPSDTPALKKSKKDSSQKVESPSMKEKKPKSTVEEAAPPSMKKAKAKVDATPPIASATESPMPRSALKKTSHTSRAAPAASLSSEQVKEKKVRIIGIEKKKQKMSSSDMGKKKHGAKAGMLGKKRH